MLYARLGSSGLIVSRLSLGTMTFTAGAGNPAIAKTATEDADRIVGLALDAGVNFIDTADVYAGGQSEEILGRVLGGRRDRVVVASKAGWRTGPGLNDWGLSARHLARSINASLRRLGTDHVDVFVAHRQDDVTPLEETLEALDGVVRSGKARYLGFSNWAAWKVAAALELQRANGWAPFTHGQMMYSLLDREIEHEVLPMARRYGLGITAWSPLANGFLTGKYGGAGTGGAGDRLTTARELAQFDWAVGQRTVDAMRPIAGRHGVSLAQVAIAWLLAKDQVASVILGATRPKQIVDSLAAADLALDAAELAALDDLTMPQQRYPTTVANLPDAQVREALAARPGLPPQGTE